MCDLHIETHTPDPGEFRLGRDIKCAELAYGQYVVDEAGTAEVFLGYIESRQNCELDFFSLSSADKKGLRDRYRFVTLRGGKLLLSKFLKDDKLYRVPPSSRVHMPRGASSDFGVYHDDVRGLDESLTRHFFGLTFDELDYFLAVLGHAVWGAQDEYRLFLKPRITFSKTRDNDCDVANVWIPKNFPFIAFSETQNWGGHIALPTLYRTATLLTLPVTYASSHEFPFQESLQKCGATTEIMSHIRAAAHSNGASEIFSLADALRLYGEDY